MKKKLFTLIIIMLSSFTFVAAAVNWKGSEQVTNIKSNLQAIDSKMDELKNSNKDKDKIIKDIEKLLDEQKAAVREKDKELEQLRKEVDDKQKEIERLMTENGQVKTDNNFLQKQLDQAVKDLQDIEKLTEDLLKN
ncbi:MAG: hypothetical protein GX187_08325 [Clostridiaceae bacterium]|nr:hypothetical protein [Clostridiaceae bacterium]